MDWEDIAYIFLLLFCMGFGYIYRQIENVNQRKLTGTIVGLGLLILVSGIHILHVLIFTLFNILIIQLVSRKKCHLVSFAFSFTYLMFFRTTEYFGIPYANGHTNLVMMVLTLKLVGLAFEINSSYMLTAQSNGDFNDEQIAEQEYKKINPSYMDIVHYTFNYIGILTGPYYTYRSFYDSLHKNFYKYALCNQATLERLAYLPLYSTFFLVANYYWPLSYALSDEFYNDRSFWYRLWYCLPNFFIFRYRLFIGIKLSEGVCSMAGMGAYPSKLEPKPGAGPTKNFAYLKEVSADEEKAKVEQYNFEAINNIIPYNVEVCLTVREAMKNWNMCIQYWLAMNVYKRFPSKKWRTFATLFVSAIWHGIYIGHYFTICGAPVYLPIEDIYVKLFVKENNKNVKLWVWIITISKTLTESYLAFAFTLLTVPNVVRYYNSIYHVGLIIFLVLYLVGLYLLQERKKHNKPENVKKD